MPARRPRFAASLHSARAVSRVRADVHLHRHVDQRPAAGRRRCPATPPPGGIGKQAHRDDQLHSPAASTSTSSAATCGPLRTSPPPAAAHRWRSSRSTSSSRNARISAWDAIPPGPERPGFLACCVERLRHGRTCRGSPPRDTRHETRDTRLGSQHAVIHGDERGLLLLGQALVGTDGRLHGHSGVLVA